MRERSVRGVLIDPLTHFIYETKHEKLRVISSVVGFVVGTWPRYIARRSKVGAKCIHLFESTAGFRPNL